MMQTRVLTSLSKVFADEECRDLPVSSGTALRGERHSFQVAYRSDMIMKGAGITVSVDGDLSARVYGVGLVPCELPYRQEHDDRVLRTPPGLYPDPLYPLDPNNRVDIPPNQWRAVWISVNVPDDASPGTHTIIVEFVAPESVAADDAYHGRAEYELEILPHSLTKQRLIHTEWFHQDGLATYYGVPIHGKQHWEILGAFLETAVSHGINMILTPLFTPPLDTAPGGERPTAQLVGVQETDGGYEFDFSLLDRWITLCLETGVEYFEMSHLATQWGAAHCPKIVARDSTGEEHRLFGWDDDSTGERYLTFLEAFLPRLDAFLKERGIAGKTYFHVSDEPRGEHLETYSRFAAHLKRLLPGYPFIDALSDFEFYKSGAVEHPIPASNHIEPFLEAGIDGLWTYYCVGQWEKVSNRYFIMPSVRNRIIGFQLFKYDIAGFLHWGYNFYYSQYSLRQDLDPFRETDAGLSFPSGDPFLVYPGPDGVPVESLRLKVFHEALQDLRLYQTAATGAGKDTVVAVFEKAVGSEITFSEYPCDIGLFMKARKAVQELL